MKIKKACCVLLLLAAFYSDALAQFSQPFLRKIGKNEGLSGSLVLSMVQDKRDLYWIGTLNGLQLFDGKTFKKYPLPFSQNGILGSNSISSLLVDGDSILWVAHYQGIAKFNVIKRVFTYIPVPKETSTQTLAITSIFKDEENEIWCTSFELGLIKYNVDKGSFEKAGDQDLQSKKRVKALALDKDHLFICHKEGCAIFDKRKNRLLSDAELPAEYKWINSAALKGEVFEAFIDRDTVYAQIWNHDAVSYDFIRLNKKTAEVSKGGIKTVSGRKFFQDGSGNIWMYGDGLHVLLHNSGEIVQIKEDLKEGRQFDFTMCQRMFEDKEDNIWICTNSGLFVFNRHDKNAVIGNDSDENGYVKHPYNSICERSNGLIWAGTFGEGLLELAPDLKLKRTIDFRKKKDDPHYNLIWSMYETAEKKDVWIGCQKGRLILYDRAKDDFVFYNDEVFENKTIMSITEAQNGDVFFGTNGGSIIRKKKDSEGFEEVFRSAMFANRTVAGSITSMFCKGDQLFAATNYDGIVQVDLKTLQKQFFRLSVSDPGSLKSNNVFALLPDGQKGYFAGTSNGLGYYDYSKKKFDSFTLYDGLPFNNVYDLVPGNDNSVIAATSDGLYRINWMDRSFERIGKNGNLYKGYNAVKISADRRSLLLANDEFLYSLPIHAEQKKIQPHSYIYTISSLDKNYFITEGSDEIISFDKDHTTVNISFGASTFNYYNSVDYFYMLSGIDQNWVPAGNNRTVTYSKLKGGNYTFRLKCVFQEDKNSSEELSMSFSVAKPFNQTIWFYLLLLIAVCTFFYVVYRIRVNRLLEIEKIRFGLSRDLHDDMGSTLSTINILSVIAEEKLKQDTQVSSDYLKRITSISQQMMESMDDIIWSINPVNDNMERVIVRMREFAAGILEPKNIKLEFDVDDKVSEIGIKMKGRRDLFLIFKEAINNSAKYSGAKTVRITISIINRSLYMSISDDGKGFVITDQNKGNGLLNMKKRAEDLNGRLELHAAPGEGTRVTLIIALNKL
jgi:ligand-binding sensor domain-containing protein/two-component sensor histidine kinase